MSGVSQPTTGRLHQLQLYEHTLACRMAAVVANRFIIGVLRAASRVGDWPLSVLVGLMLLGGYGLRGMALFAATSLTAVAIQKLIKERSGRPRPCERPDGPPQRAPIPDHGSFPSGHTLHAVMAAIVVCQLIPSLAAPFVLVAALVAISRVVLGVHYPSDVVAGGAIGAIFGVALTILI
jgi:undecaprenyl-diphosphatase